MAEIQSETVLVDAAPYSELRSLVCVLVDYVRNLIMIIIKLDQYSF
jgi:hypothetical protein